MSERAIVIYVDVDDTFVRSFGAKRIAMPHVLEHVKSLHAAGAELYCWSTAGGDYARASAEEFGIAHCFRAFLPKPEVFLDDRALSDWRRVEVHPNECGSLTIDEVRARLAR